MTTPIPRPNVPGPTAPLPGRHLLGTGEPADPERIRAEVRELLAELGPLPPAEAASADGIGGTDLARRAHILEQAHEVLVQALATVDKI